MTSIRLMSRLSASFLLILVAATASAQSPRTERLAPDGVGKLLLITGSITGDETIDYVIDVGQSQILSVDLETSNASTNFNILPAGSNEAIFIGSTEGQVADVPAPLAGDYVIRIYLMGSAAEEGATVDYTLGVSIGAPEYADALSGGPDYWEVAGVSSGDALNVRGGPSTRYAAISKLSNGEVLQNRGCRLTGDERWCQIRAAGSGVTGWVAGRFLVETAAPQSPAALEGGPVGNGGPFDATGTVPCATAADQPTRQCPFGVVREGPGNAGVWIALGDGKERYILFEGGAPIATDGPLALSYDKADDLFVVQIGEERYEIPDAMVNGG
jgi:uncharacterized protein YgiM (DUF1202 family)